MSWKASIPFIDFPKYLFTPISTSMRIDDDVSRATRSQYLFIPISTYFPLQHTFADVFNQISINFIE